MVSRRLDVLILVVLAFVVLEPAAAPRGAPQLTAGLPGDLSRASVGASAEAFLGAPLPSPHGGVSTTLQGAARTPSDPSPSGAPTPSPRAKAVTRLRKPQPVGSIPTGGSAVRGIATWFCLPGRSACTVGYDPSCTCGAAGPALRVGEWRGRVVTVTAGRASVRVRLVDWCSCGGGRVIDLFGYVFGQLAPGGLGQGTLDVAVTW